MSDGIATLDFTLPSRVSTLNKLDYNYNCNLYRYSAEVKLRLDFDLVNIENNNFLRLIM